MKPILLALAALFDLPDGPFSFVVEDDRPLRLRDSAVRYRPGFTSR